MLANLCVIFPLFTMASYNVHCTMYISKKVRFFWKNNYTAGMSACLYRRENSIHRYHDGAKKLGI